MAAGLYPPPPRNIENVVASGSIDLVTVRITPDMARLLARLQQLRNQGATVTVDLDAMELQVHGRIERMNAKAG